MLIRLRPLKIIKVKQQRRHESQKRRCVKTKGTVAADIKKSLKDDVSIVDKMLAKYLPEAKVDDVKYGKGKGWDQPEGKSMTSYKARHSYLKKNPDNVRSDRNKRHSAQDVIFHGHDKVERDRKKKHFASKGVKKVKLGLHSIQCCQEHLVRPLVHGQKVKLGVRFFVIENSCDKEYSGLSSIFGSVMMSPFLKTFSHLFSHQFL